MTGHLCGDTGRDGLIQRDAIAFATLARRRLTGAASFNGYLLLLRRSLAGVSKRFGILAHAVVPRDDGD
jgi:hypothetical protein